MRHTIRTSLAAFLVAGASFAANVAPAHAGPPTEFDARMKVVTLGDSYSSGTGYWAESYNYDQVYGGDSYGYKLTVRADNACWRETDATPGPRYAAATNRRSIFLACKGALATHVQNQFDLLNAQWPSDSAGKWNGSVILLSAGGNDMLTWGGQDWPEMLASCITTSTCHELANNQISNMQVVGSRLSSLYTNIAQRASGAKIRIMGYPKVMQPYRNLFGTVCPAVTGISVAEATWMDGIATRLNDQVAAEVAAVKAANPSVDIKFVPLTGALTGGACEYWSSNRSINDRVVAPITGSGLLRTSDSSFHPTAMGWSRMYSPLVNSL
jgi:GDSL-like Lipase/Acylhydrolase family